MPPKGATICHIDIVLIICLESYPQVLRRVGRMLLALDVKKPRYIKRGFLILNYGYLIIYEMPMLC
jgi:hypothetical protein